jgi:hypothetical protein
MAQDLATSLAEKFDAYQKKHQDFKTLLVFSQEKYVPGDTAFFAAWFLTEAGQFVGDDQILNLDMIDFEGKVVQHILFRVRDGIGANQVIIGANTRPGVYVMSVYNDCMRSKPGSISRKQITVVNKNKIVARAFPKPADNRQIRITASNDFVNVNVAIAGQKGKDLVLTVTSGGQLYFTAAFRFTKKDTVTIRLPRKHLSGGDNLFSVLSKESVLATQHYYMPLSLRFDVSLLHDTVATRQQLFSEIKISDASGKPVSVPFTVSVVNANIDMDETAQNLLSEPFAWSDLLLNKTPATIKPPKLITMYGQVLDNNETPAPEGSVVNCFMKKSRFAFEAGVEKNGRVEMIFLDFFGSEDMFYYVEHDGKEIVNAKIRWVITDIAQEPSVRADETNRPDSYARFIEKKRLIDRSFNYFSNAVRDSVTQTIIPLEAEFENLGTVINLAEYKIFPTMEETIRELIPRLSYRSAGGRNIIKVNLSEVDLKVTGGPLYVIDNKLTKDPDHFLSLVPDALISVRVIHDPKELKRFMPVSRNGIVVVKTRNGARKTIIKENTLAVTGLSAPVAFVALKPGQPEFRSTISWQPFAKTDADGKANISFVTSDDAGRIKIRIRGVYGGQLFSTEKEIVVNLEAAH